MKTSSWLKNVTRKNTFTRGETNSATNNYAKRKKYIKINRNDAKILLVFWKSKDEVKNCITLKISFDWFNFNLKKSNFL